MSHKISFKGLFLDVELEQDDDDVYVVSAMVGGIDVIDWLNNETEQFLNDAAVDQIMGKGKTLISEQDQTNQVTNLFDKSSWFDSAASPQFFTETYNTKRNK